MDKTDILKSIVKKVKENIKDISIYTQDIERGFKRPCFFIVMNPIKNENYRNNYMENYIDFNIFYFPRHKKQNQIELLDITDKLTNTIISNPKLIIEDDEEKIYSDLIDFSFSSDDEDVLNFRFTTLILCEIENSNENLEIMDSLEIGEDKYDD